MDVKKFLKISRKNKKCPECKNEGSKEKPYYLELENEVIKIKCHCGFYSEIK